MQRPDDGRLERGSRSVAAQVSRMDFASMGPGWLARRRRVGTGAVFGRFGEVGEG